MQNSIEVVGAAQLVETAAEYRADLTMSVRAAQTETAVNEATELRRRCVESLRKSGLRDSELQEGGADVWRPWYGKRKAGQEASHRILLACDDMQRLSGALAALEPLFENQRHTLSVFMRPPRFATSEEARRSAEREALANARTKAENIAAAAGLCLRGVVEVEELGSKIGHSGAYGDEAWGGYAAAAMGPGAGADEDAPVSLDPATRSSTIRFRVRFACQQPA
ncbi:SIMPL domain-containing protein [Eleftheria terrae]|uniref:SIMPL domain-containing protein n=1 Tax=Eleftheria terrae TaxID=1597781 RepID=UPI00263AD1BE|nr:SIMPL domain-containing protein [Eleftheria terrae]WKB50638.1 SIMPL domain-containing protein [Eleftheria terrae]